MKLINSFLLKVSLAVLVLGPVVHAQFSGPAPDNTYGVNRPQVITTDPAMLYPPDREITLTSGDLLAVHIYGQADYVPMVRLSLDGAVDLPYIGVVHLQGLTLHQAERAIAERLIAAGMYTDPQVSVQVNEAPNQVITVSGEIHAIVPALGKRRLFDALTAAGGFTPTSSHVVTIQRSGQAEPILVDLGNDPAKSSLANVPLYSGDTVIVSRTGVVYMLGAFRTQSAIPLGGNTPLTALQAIAVAGGANFEGKREDTRIIRTQGTKRFEVKVNMARVFAGKDPDPVLQPDDILYLPSSAIKSAIRAGGIATLIGVAQISSYIAVR